MAFCRKPLTLALLANQIVCVCAYLSNFPPAMVPLPQLQCVSEGNVDKYSQSLADCNSGSELNYDNYDKTSSDDD